MRPSLTTGFLIWLLALPTFVSSETRVFRNATIYPVAGPAIENGALVIEDGKIVTVGPSATITAPAGALITDLSGKVVIPGMVDTHSHIGSPSGGDRSAASGPADRAINLGGAAQACF